MSRLPYFLDNPLTDSGMVTRWPHSWYSIPLRCWLHPRAIVQPEGLGQFRIPMNSLGIKPMTFRPVAQCLNHYTTMCPDSTLPLVNIPVPRRVHRSRNLVIITDGPLEWEMVRPAWISYKFKSHLQELGARIKKNTSCEKLSHFY
jgi:hypothetical protein